MTCNTYGGFTPLKHNWKGFTMSKATTTTSSGGGGSLSLKETTVVQIELYSNLLIVKLLGCTSCRVNLVEKIYFLYGTKKAPQICSRTVPRCRTKVSR